MYSLFTEVTGAHMLCPSAIIGKDHSISANKETIQRFIDEMQSINFHEFASGDCHSLPQSYVPNDLLSCSEVWVRVDRVCKSLEAPYSAPYRVVHREQKYFVLRLAQGNTSVSIDRLKPAYLPVVKRPANSASPVSPCSDLPSGSTPSHASISVPPPGDDSSQASPCLTRSGRTIHFCRHPDYVYY